ncbi:TPM domain-containing protein [Microbacterium sp. LRZ72]|uniref:TPM domain-containing protein n=1 Tax=Microbacterium sp. LRZ72 TaxID=2942481 RepID=UPI0029A48CC4|nr:TPM domain-containing protein [Microbacterium sp. LRZ72]MDX2376543.1 TPM domain-containing protein [Microbacterium sp. LRZ72]
MGIPRTLEGGGVMGGRTRPGLFRANVPLMLALGMLLVLAPAWAASAAAPVTLGAGYVVDEAGVLTAAEEADAQAALQRLQERTGIDLWVVFVDAFADPASPEAWANATAELNGLGPHQYLLAVAVQTRQFYVSGDAAGPVPFDRLGEIEQNDIQPALAAGEWVGAVNAAVDGVAAAVDPDDEAGSFPTALVVVLGLLVLAGVIVAIVLARRTRRGATAQAGGRTTPPGAKAPTVGMNAPVTDEELARRTASALIATDDAVRTSAQEVDFARAQFGDAATADFAATLARARTDLAEAFSLQQRLDDDEPDAAADVRAWRSRILELCERASASLDAKTAAFDELRELERTAPAAIEAARGAHAARESGLDAAAAALAELQGRFAPEELSPVVDNPAQARDRLDWAAERLDEATRAVESGRAADAALEITAAEDAIAQAGRLEAAIAARGDDLSAAERRGAELLAEVVADAAAARVLPDADGRVAGALSYAEAGIGEARRLLQPPRRPLAALDVLRSADARLDEALAHARDALERARRTERARDAAFAGAQAQIDAASNFIAARRGAVGATARTRLAEADTVLASARSGAAGPAAATAGAQRAAELAAAALQQAQHDLRGFTADHGGGAGGSALGALIGGVVLSSMLGGASRRGGFGGAIPGGLFGGGGGARGSSRSRRGGGGFGGLRTSRGRRGGGRF